jgi:chromosome segregation ATPase
MIVSIAEKHNELVKLQLRVIEATSDVVVLEARNQRVMQLLEKQKAKVRDLIERRDRAKSKAAKAQEKVVELQEGLSQEEQAYLSSPESLERTVEDLDRDIEQLQDRLGLIHNSNPNAIRQYEERAQKITKLQSKIETVEARIEQLRTGITEIRNQWEPELDKLVERISNAFSKSFAKIQCAGEVRVHKEEDDFAKWAIEIRVKFREEEKLQLLDSHRQSGGERAVSTVFYLMALQSMAKSPFRVVDEINQGMDPRNERMVHHRMVNIACQEHTSQ